MYLGENRMFFFLDRLEPLMYMFAYETFLTKKTRAQAFREYVGRTGSL